MKNLIVADIFEGTADILEIKNENPFKIRAYRRAALNIKGLAEDVEALAKEDKLSAISGIGKELEAKIKEIIATGSLKYYEKLKKEVPQGILDLMLVPGIGPKTARVLHDSLKINSVQDLEKKARSHEIRGLPGLKEKTEENILRGIELVKKRAGRMSLKEALDLAGEIVPELEKLSGVKKISVAGSLRRMKETVRDIDILLTSSRPRAVMGAFVKLPLVRDVLAHGDTKSSILTENGIQIDVRVVEERNFGAALLYFTGSQAHNIHIRHIAKKMGMKVNEYGVFLEKTNRSVAGRTEEEVYKAMKLSFIPPELREDRGEIEAAAKGKLPKLLELSDIKGDLHVHSKWSDGMHSVEEIARAAKRKGYEYIAITDHSKTLKVARGLSEKDVMKKMAEIERVNKKIKGIKVLCGTEVDILQDGSLDYDKRMLKRFDIVVAAIHSGFKEPKEKLTTRVIKAMESGLVHILAHPTGRLMGSRDPYELDFAKIFKTAIQTRTCMEISAFHERLDLDDVNSRAAKEAGVKLAIGTDAHIIDQLDSMLLGLSVARRAWLEKKDVLNTSDLDSLLKLIRK